MSDERRYVALIGDIQGSQEAEDRAELQERFEAAVAAANSDVGSDPASPLTITAGDEFQALFGHPPDAPRAIGIVSDYMAPRMLRFGVGFGTLETGEPNPEQAIGMDGPCLRNARLALHDAKDEEGWVRLAGFVGEAEGRRAPPVHDHERDTTPWKRPVLDYEVGRVLDAAGALRSGWTDRQSQFARALREEGHVQKRVANRLDVAESTVSESLRSARYREVRRAEEAMKELVSILVSIAEEREEALP